jgi:hypothetical protein
MQTLDMIADSLTAAAGEKVIINCETSVFGPPAIKTDRDDIPARTLLQEAIHPSWVWNFYCDRFACALNLMPLRQAEYHQYELLDSSP